MHRPAGWERRAKAMALPLLALSGMLALSACETLQSASSEPTDSAHAQTMGQRLPPALQAARLLPPPSEAPRSRLLIEPGRSSAQQRPEARAAGERQPQTPAAPAPRREAPSATAAAPAPRSAAATGAARPEQNAALPPVPPTRPRSLLSEAAGAQAATAAPDSSQTPSEPTAPSEPIAEPARDVGKPEEQPSEPTAAPAQPTPALPVQPEQDTPTQDQEEAPTAEQADAEGGDAPSASVQPGAPEEQEIDLEVFEEEERPVQEAALPSPALAEGVRLEFESGSSDLTQSMEDRLLALAQQLREDESERLRLEAYAAGYDQDMSGSRRLSLSRALAVRAFLLDQGIRSTRMDVRAIGRSASGQADRVDILPAER